MSFSCYWSRSRQNLWQKGESSGNTQKVTEIRTDCDQDVVWISVTQTGGAACHTGRKSCFYRLIPVGQKGLESARLERIEADRVFDPDEIYGN